MAAPYRRIPRQLAESQARHMGRYVRAERRVQRGGPKALKVIHRLTEESIKLDSKNMLTIKEKMRLATRLIEQAAFMANHLYFGELLVTGKGNWNKHLTDWLRHIENNVPEKLRNEIKKRTIVKRKKR